MPAAHGRTWFRLSLHLRRFFFRFTKVRDMLTKKIWIGSFAVLSLAGVSAALLQRTSANDSHDAAVSTSVAESAAHQDGPGWARGARYSYDFSVSISMEMPQDPAAPSVEHDDMALSGLLHTTVVTRNGERVVLAYEISGARMQDGSASSAEEAVALQRDVEKPFYVELDERRAVTAVSFDAGLSVNAQTLLRNLVATLRVPGGAQSSPSWTEREMDTNGECNVRYACTAGACSKEKLGYIRLTSGRGLVTPGPRSPRVQHSRFDYTADKHARLLRMSGKEIGVVDLLGTPLRAELKLTAALKAISMEAGAIAAVPAGLNRMELATTAGAFAGSGKAELPEDLKGATAASLVEAYLKLDPADRDGRGKAVARLSSLLQHDTQAIAEATRLIKEGGPAARLLAETLGGANSTEGQAALANVMGDSRVATDVRAAAMRSALLIEQPNPTLIDALRTEMKGADPELRNRARVAFGAGANRLHESQPDVARGMTNELLKDFNSASSSEERIAALRALGNTGSDAAASTLTQAASDPDPSVREAAMRALRFIKDPSAGRVISRALAFDPSFEVRRAALFAAEFQPTASVEPAVAKLARTDADNALRGEAIRVLGKMSDDPDALQTLTDLSTHEPDLELRALAASLLNQALARVD
jgi:HEAT repeat protein